MKRRVVVTGVGAITPVGNDVATTWRALVDGQSGAGPITKFDASGFPVRFACEVKSFDPWTYMDRKEAKRTWKWEGSNLVIGPAPDFPSMSARQVVATSLPTGEITPRPVTTTLRRITDRPWR